MWKESAKKWLANDLKALCGSDDIDELIQVLDNGRQSIDSECKIIVSSYDLLAKNVDIIAQSQYKVIIADECHLLKNSKASRTKAALKLIENCQRVILLSGTPALSRSVLKTLFFLEVLKKSEIVVHLKTGGAFLSNSSH
jgi:SNF2 family DNA or RNA helicase